ncbi:unnamed protein product [Protopolystoma xenopodis]|uniref:Uncharacterized protein n=1 Tax=Protopolystoma xenopodis TaxID=117903 RepID=A0A3S5AAG1_9PLAT|nr:unnamed protein product [Protopolystoma xenopodis]
MLASGTTDEDVFGRQIQGNSKHGPRGGGVCVDNEGLARKWRKSVEDGLMREILNVLPDLNVWRHRLNVYSKKD